MTDIQAIRFVLFMISGTLFCEIITNRELKAKYHKLILFLDRVLLFFIKPILDIVYVNAKASSCSICQAK
jgi:hypothetical protein